MSFFLYFLYFMFGFLVADSAMSSKGKADPSLWAVTALIAVYMVTEAIR